jgi:CheY-like chemotaxis protein/nitrogen-specific signal transduction histidine kinase
LREHLRERERLLASERAARAMAEASAAEAQRASDAKSTFLATLSHELRTPLTPVLLNVSLIERHAGLPVELREDVAAIRRNVELESRLISDLLDLTRIANGKLQLDQQDVDLHSIVRAAIDICQREASAKLVLELKARRHVVRGDTTRLQQIFWNLVSNAEKFTGPEGTITVRTLEAPGNRVRVQIIDTGSGIDPSILPRLFNVFEQGDARVMRQQAGLGLGLAISRKLTEAHGGTIAAASEGRGRGATFTVELPLPEPSTRTTATPRRPSVALASTGRLRVLLVEDHEPTLRALGRLLRQIGHTVTEVTTVASATATAAQDGFDLIISDLGLPDGSGLDVMRHLRDRYEGRAIALTGFGMESDIVASREAGFAAHLTKPVDLVTLEAAIQRVLGPAFAPK